MSVVRWGIIGLGMGRHHCGHIAKMENATLVAVADLDESRGKEAEEKLGVKWYQDYKEMVRADDVDVVMVCTPSGLHAQMGIVAAEAGKHMLVEKPIDVTLEAADRLIETCHKSGVKLGVSLQNRFSRLNTLIKEQIEAGTFGKLLLGEARVKWSRSQAYYDQGGWRGTWKMDGGGAIMNQSVHYIDLLQWFLGKVDTIAAKTATMTHQIETEDLALAIVTFENGAFGTILGATCLEPKPDTTEIYVHGTEGFSGNGLNGELVGNIVTSETQNVRQWPAHPIDDMTAAILENRSPYITGEEGRKSLSIIHALYQSTREGREVKVSYSS